MKKRTILFGIAILGSVAGQAQTRLDLHTQTKSMDFSGASSTKPFRSGASLPPGCGANEVFLQNDLAGGVGVYVCSTPNSWWQFGAGSTAGNGAPQFRFSGQTLFAPSTTTAPVFTLPAGDAPGAPGAGDFWVSGNRLWWHNGLRSAAFIHDDGTGSVSLTGSLATGTGGDAAGSIVALQGTGRARIALQGSTAGEWGITAPASFTSWDFTPPAAPCSARQWWTTDAAGVGVCSQPGFADLSGAITTGQLGGSVGGDLTGTLPAPTVAKINGTSFPPATAADQVPVTTAAGTAAWTMLPACLDSGGGHLNYDTTTHSFSCGTSGGGGAGTVTHTTGALTASAPVIGNGGGDIKPGSTTGNTTTFVTSAGSRSAGNCAKWDANGNLVDSGGACGGSGGGTGVMLIGGSLGNTGIGGAAAVFGIPFSGSTANGGFVWSSPVTGTVKNLYVTTRAGGFTQPSDGAVTCTMLLNGNSTSLVAAVPANYVSPTQPSPTGNINDLTHAVAVTAGDALVLKCVNGSASASINLVSWSAVVQ